MDRALGTHTHRPSDQSHSPGHHHQPVGLSLPTGARQSFEDGGEERLRIIDADWPEDPSGALKALRAALRERITWIVGELYPDSMRAATDRAAIQRLEADGLISPQQARVAKALFESSGRVLARGFDADEKTRDAVIGFMRSADRVAYQLRLIALDTSVRHELRKRRLKLLDLRQQPRGRWPDFYAFDPKHLDRPLRVAVRMARSEPSSLVSETRRRMRRKWLETPLDEHVQRVIVVPNTSCTRLEADAKIPANVSAHHPHRRRGRWHLERRELDPPRSH